VFFETKQVVFVRRTYFILADAISSPRTHTCKPIELLQRCACVYEAKSEWEHNTHTKSLFAVRGTLEVKHFDCGKQRGRRTTKGAKCKVKQLTQIGNNTDMQIGGGNRNSFSRRKKGCQTSSQTKAHVHVCCTACIKSTAPHTRILVQAA